MPTEPMSQQANDPPYHTRLALDGIDDDLREQVRTLWRRHQALAPAEVEQRLPQVVAVVHDADGELVAVSSVDARLYPALGHRFFAFRCFVDAEHRRAGLAARLIREVFDACNARHRDGQTTDVIGMIAEAENPGLNRDHNQAVWPHSRFVFVGYNSLGQQVRVRYFDGARVASRI